MTNKEAIKLLVNATYSDAWQGNENLTTAHHMAIKALSTEPCEDCVSRERVVEWLHHCTDDSIEHAIDSNLEFIPSVIPKLEEKQRVCKWIKYDCCTICPKEHDVDDPYWRMSENRMNTLKYCPYCGARMEIAESEE